MLARLLALLAMLTVSVTQILLSAAAFSAEPASPKATQRSSAAASVKSKEAEQALVDRALSLNQQAAEQYNKGQFQQACELETQALSLFPDQAVLWENKANFLLAMGKSADALACFDKSIALEPGASAFASKACALANLGRFSESITASTEAIKLDPQHWKGWNNRAEAYYQQGDLKKAKADVDKTIEINPQAATALAMRGSLKMRSKDLDGAQADLDRSLQIDPTVGLIWCSRATVSWRKKDKESALKYVQKAALLAPNNPVVKQNKTFMETHSVDDPAGVTTFNGIVLDPEQKASQLKSGTKPGAESK